MASIIKGPQQPKPTPPPPLPDTNGPEAMEAKRRTIANAMSGGRSSTVLTNGGNTIAGGAYGATKLGGA